MKQRPYVKEWQEAIEDFKDYMLGADEALGNLSGGLALSIAEKEIEFILAHHLKEAQSKEAAYEQSTT